MNPLVSALVGAGVRWLVTAAATYGVTVSDDNATQIISGLAGLGSLAYSFWQKHNQSKVVEKAAVTGVVPQ